MFVLLFVSKEHYKLLKQTASNYELECFSAHDSLSQNF